MKTLSEKIEDLAVKEFPVKTLDELMFSVALQVAFMRGATVALLEIDETKALYEAGDNMREELSNFWGGSKGECKWLSAMKPLIELREHEKAKELQAAAQSSKS